MNICSVCLKCYDDSIAICTVDKKHGTLTPHRKGKGLDVGDYQIESLFESASPVELFRATHNASGNNVLISFINKDECLYDPEEELRAAGDVEHPALLSILEFGNVDTDELFVVYEDLTGQSLLGLLNDSKAPSELQAISVVRQVSEALEVLHSSGLVHKSVSPANIYLTEGGELGIKLIKADFGGISGNSFLTAASTGFEPLNYCAPEQFNKEKADYGTDLYRLAAVFYELLLGRRHIETGNAETVKSFVFDESDVWDLHHELRALIAHVLRQSFQQRAELRPPSTNNFVRQMRYIELIAKRLSENASEKRGHESHYIPAVAPAARQVGLIDDVPEALSASVAVDTSGKDDGPIREVRHLPDADEVVFDDFDIEEAFKPDLTIPVMPVVTRQATGSSRTFLYAAGLLCAALVGGIVTAGFYDRQIGTTEPQQSAVVQKQAQQEDEPAAESDETPIETTDEDADQIEDRSRELDQVINLASAPVSLPEKKSAAKAASFAKKPVKTKPRRKKKSNRRTKQKAKAEQASTRPRIVKDIIIYY